MIAERTTVLRMGWLCPLSASRRFDRSQSRRGASTRRSSRSDEFISTIGIGRWRAGHADGIRLLEAQGVAYRALSARAARALSVAIVINPRKQFQRIVAIGESRAVPSPGEVTWAQFLKRLRPRPRSAVPLKQGEPMRPLVSAIPICEALVFAACVPACTANIHDNTVSIPNANVAVSSSADTTNVKPGESLPVAVKVDNVALVEPGAMPPSNNAMQTGHLEIHIDSDSAPAILVTAQTSFSITIPSDIKPGDHKVICRVDKDDGTPTSAEADLSFTVKAATST